MERLVVRIEEEAWHRGHVGVLERGSVPMCQQVPLLKDSKESDLRGCALSALTLCSTLGASGPFFVADLVVWPQLCESLQCKWGLLKALSLVSAFGIPPH